VKPSAALASSLPGFDIPTNTVQENGTYGGQGKAVGVSHPGGFAVCGVRANATPNAGRMLGQAMIKRDRLELLLAAVAGAVIGVVAGYLDDSRGLGLVMWAVGFAVIVSGLVYFLRGFR
jgi:hypothetical protein